MKTGTAKLYNWATLKASSSKAPFWVAILFGLELFLFVPLDAILMFFCLHNPRRTFLYVFIAATASVFSALVGYMLGHLLWDFVGSYIVPHLVSESLFNRISSQLMQYESGAIFIGAFIPFPLKALSVAAGVFHLALPAYLSAIFSARLLRFGLIGIAMLIWGDKVKIFLERHFHRVILILIAKMAIIFTFFWAAAT